MKIELELILNQLESLRAKEKSLKKKILLDRAISALKEFNEVDLLK